MDIPSSPTAWVLYLDEPTTSLDPRGRNDLWRWSGP